MGKNNSDVSHGKLHRMLSPNCKKSIRISESQNCFSVGCLYSHSFVQLFEIGYIINLATSQCLGMK